MAAERSAGYLARMKFSRFSSVLLLLATLFALAFTGCQTSRGFGKDVENLGNKIQDKSK